MKVPFRPTGLALAAAAAFATVASAEEAKDLRLVWKAGEKLVYDSVTASTVEMGPMGKFEFEFRQTDEITVESVDPKGMGKVRVKTPRAKISLGMAGMTARWDSEKPDEPTGADALPFPGIGDLLLLGREMMGLAYGATVSSRGEVSGVTEATPFVEKALEKLAEKAPMAGMFQGVFRNESFTQRLNEWLRVYPEKPVKPGDTWTVPLEVPAGQMGTATGTAACTLEKAEKGYAQIEVTAPLELKKREGDGGGGDPMAGMIAMMKLKEGRHTRTVTLDLGRGGVIRKSSGSTRIVLEAEGGGMEMAGVFKTEQTLQEKK